VEGYKSLTVSPDSFQASLEKLISKFQSDKEHYLAKGYSEAQARIDFITPLFRALGWDFENEAGLPHSEREVVVEQRETDVHGYPDYSFRVNGRTKFFVEAKAPSETLDDTRHILQAKGYAWSTKSVFFVVLTNFEEFRFYDASIKPDERNPNEGLLFKVRYTDYLRNVQKLWDFSRDRVMSGSLDAMLPRDRRTERLRIAVDEAFLDEMTVWRGELARDVFKNNRGLTARQLNEIVQRLLDRIVFIRIAEDRRVIERYQLRAAAEEWRARGGKFPIFDWLRPLFEKINADFNGEIFKPNELLEKTEVDSEIVARIIERLYPPKSPYRFDVIGVELLGSIYERYLGSTIRVTARQVRVEEKPEVRHAGGVYYTPQYIVDYVVKETVGKIIEGKTPKQIEKIRILDPACGSGSFLIGAFQYLIDYHVRYLSEHPQEARVHPLFPDLLKDENGEYRLSVIRKGRILRNNLYGVDIDPQAVEITMMSLYLKALEGERTILPSGHQYLPELKYNIRCGNSLIGPEVKEQGTLFGDADRDRINAFDWHAAFPEIFKLGGFDAVIGNPPYIRVQTLQEWAPFEVEFYKRHYTAASSGNYDIYVVFVEKGLSLLRSQGKLGYILPHKFFNAKYGEPLRALITKGSHLSEIVHFGDQQVFEGATNYTCLLFLEKDGKRKFEFTKVDDLEAWRTEGKAVRGTIPASRATASEWNFAVGGGVSVFARLSKMPVKLKGVAHVFVGTQTSADEVFVLDNCRQRGKRLSGASKSLDREVTVEGASTVPFLRGKEIRRYQPLHAAARLLCPYVISEQQFRLLRRSEMADKLPLALAYLASNRRLLERRERGRFNGESWYAFGYPKSMTLFQRPKIVVPDYNNVPSFTFDSGGHFFKTGYGILLTDASFSAFYLLGLLNSKLLFKYLSSISTFLRGGYVRFWTQFVEQLPIRTIDFSDAADKLRHDRIVVLVTRMLDLNKRKHSGRLAPSERDDVERDIAATDAEIDNLVYELYRITDEEREMIEGA
jgi:type I restriction-modification system DNA methylase subunit